MEVKVEKLEKLEKNKVSLEVTVPADQVDKALARAYRQVVKKVTIPGFRKGHVPRKILEMRLGKGVLYEEALDILLPEAYTEAVKETKIEPIDQPQVTDVDLEEGKPCRFTAVVEVKPEVKLGQYKGLQVVKKEVEVGEQDVDAYIKNLQERTATWKGIAEDEAAQDGDLVTIDFKGFVNGEPLAGGSGENYPLLLGSSSFIPGFEAQLIGAKAGEERELQVTFPEDYHNTEIAGAEAKFQVKVKEIKRKELPALDDEFAKDVGEFETLAELRQDIKQKLTASAEQKAEQEFREELITQAVANAEVEIPQVLIDRRIESMVEDLKRRLQQQGISLDAYLGYAKKTLDQVKEEFRPNAVEGIKTDLVLAAIAKVEQLVATAEEIEDELDKVAAAIEKDTAKVEEFKQRLRELGQLDIISDDIVRAKAVDILVAEAVSP